MLNANIVGVCVSVVFLQLGFVRSTFDTYQYMGILIAVNEYTTIYLKPFQVVYIFTSTSDVIAFTECQGMW